MYLDYFGLDEAPFSITPDPTFIYLSGRHRDALAHLLYGVGQGGSGGFVQLTGEVGTGKTTLCRALLEQVPPGTHIALVLNPLMGPVEMLAAICEELGIPTAGVEGSPKGLVDRLNAFLLDAHQLGERVVLVIDEAQNLSPESLEQVRLLTNLETSKEKLLQIILLGQPELRELLRRRSLRQLAQRITARYHLTPLGPDDTARYVGHRLAVAGAKRDPFTRSGLKALFRRSQGVPRLINIIADRSLAAAYAAESDRVDARMVNAAANEVQLGEPGVGRLQWPRFALAAAAALALVTVTWLVVGRFGDRPDGPPADAGPTASDSANALAASPESGATGASRLPASADTGPETRPGASPATPASEPPIGQGPASADVADSAEGPDRANGGPDSGQESSVVAVDSTGSPEAPAGVDPVPVAAPTATSFEPTPAWFEEQNLRAWSGLAAAWGKPGDGALMASSCLGRGGLGFACLQEQGTWLRIRQLGLPVVLVLQGERPGHLLLAGMEGERLMVGHGQDRRTVDRRVIESRWYGDYLVAWPQSPQWPREIGRGDTGEAVDRVLELATRTAAPYGGRAEFGVEFERWLTDFQQRNGLAPDGIVGPKTLLYLMRDSIEEPRLLTALDLGS